MKKALNNLVSIILAKSNSRLSHATVVSDRARRESGLSAFTIIELLVVIAIIAILAALIFVAYPAIVKSALQATMQSMDRLH